MDDQEPTRKSKRVRFAPGPEPVATKYRTDDGHPDHEGVKAQARPRRQPGWTAPTWGADLTPSNIRHLEEELGEICRPSLDRLKRRIGLLPLRQRPKEYLTWLANSPESDTEDEQEEDLKPSSNNKKQKRIAAQHAPSKKQKHSTSVVGLKATETSSRHRSTLSIGSLASSNGIHKAANGSNSYKMEINGGQNSNNGNGHTKPAAKRLGGLNDPVVFRKGR